MNWRRASGFLCVGFLVAQIGIAAEEGAGLGSANPADKSRPTVVSEKSDSLQASLKKALSVPPFGNLIRRNRLSVALADLSDSKPQYAGIHDDTMRYAASLPKIAILLSVFDEIQRGNIPYTPQLKERMERMIRFSSNPDSTSLIRQVGFPSIARTLEDPRFKLYDPAFNGGLWIGKDYGGGLGRWKRDPLHNISHGATARQVARFFVMLDQGRLINEWSSREMKDILSRPGIRHKFVKGLEKRPGSTIYRKSGTWRDWHCDAALVERDGRKYVAVALLEGKNSTGILARLILRLDDLIMRSATVTKSALDRSSESFQIR